MLVSTAGTTRRNRSRRHVHATRDDFTAERAWRYLERLRNSGFETEKIKERARLHRLSIRRGAAPRFRASILPDSFRTRANQARRLGGNRYGVCRLRSTVSGEEAQPGRSWRSGLEKKRARFLLRRFAKTSVTRRRLRRYRFDSFAEMLRVLG